jgi:hypothetical protein
MVAAPALRRRCRGIAGAIVLSKAALVGTRVRVDNPLGRSGLRGRVGTITGRWGDPNYVALDVLLDDGSTQLFWHHELEENNGAA